MKTKATIFALIAASILFQGAAPSGTYCINVASDAQRVQEAFGSILKLPGAATKAQVEAAIFNWVERSTKDYERRLNMAAYTPPPFVEHKNYNPAAGSPTPSAAKKKK